MNARLVAISLAVAVALSLATAWLFEMPLERAILLAPAIVFGLGLSAAVFVLLGRAAAESIRESKRPRLIVGLILGLVALITVLTLLGVELPREGA
jgi:membrane protease YdiL (CAAX protease family)